MAEKQLRETVHAHRLDDSGNVVETRVFEAGTKASDVPHGFAIGEHAYSTGDEPVKVGDPGNSGVFDPAGVAVEGTAADDEPKPARARR